MKPNGVLLRSLVLAFSCCMAFGQAPRQGPAQELRIGELLARSDQFQGRSVITRGRLYLLGEYFGQPRFVIDDGFGGVVAVSPWAPLEIPPANPHVTFRPSQTPKLMSHLIGKALTVRGIHRVRRTDRVPELLVETVAEMTAGEEAALLGPPGSSDVLRPMGMVPRPANDGIPVDPPGKVNGAVSASEREKGKERQASGPALPTGQPRPVDAPLGNPQ